MRRPYVIVNCAMSADGKTALPSRKQLRISCDEDIKRMYELRNDCDAVLVGIETVLSDDPKLTVKETYVKNPRQPLRVILDGCNRTPVSAQVLNTTTKTLIIVAKGAEKQFDDSHIEVAGCDVDTNGYLDLQSVLELLSKRGVKKLLVEGGGTIIWSFLSQKLVDELFVYIGPCIIGGKDTPTMAGGKGITDENEMISLNLSSVKKIGPGVLLHYKTRP